MYSLVTYKSGSQYSCLSHYVSFVANDDLTTVSISLACLGRWYIREGWLLVVPSKGEELKHRMFFLFSDIFIATKPCHPLHLLNSKKLACQAVYPLHQCVVDKVFGHTKSQGGLLSVSLPIPASGHISGVRLVKQVSSCLSSSGTEMKGLLTTVKAMN